MTEKELEERIDCGPKRREIGINLTATQSDGVDRPKIPISEEMLDGPLKGLVEAIPPYRIVATELNVDPLVVISETIIGFTPTSKEATNFIWYFAGWLAGTISSSQVNRGVTWTMELREEGAHSDYLAVWDGTKKIEVTVRYVGEEHFKADAHYNWDWEDSSERMQELFNELFFSSRR